jgi:hypothetical protein
MKAILLRRHQTIRAVIEQECVPVFERSEAMGPFEIIRSKIQFRSPERDRTTDLARIESIHKAIQAALTTASNEIAGVRTRLAAATQDAAVLAGTDVDDKHRDAGQEKLLLEVERRLVAGGARVQQLDRHLDDLRRVERFLIQTFPEIAAPVPASDGSERRRWPRL